MKLIHSGLANLACSILFFVIYFAGSLSPLHGQTVSGTSSDYHYHTQFSYMGEYSKYKFYNHLFYNPEKQFDIGVRLVPIILGKSDNFPVVCPDSSSSCHEKFVSYYGTGYGLFFHYNLSKYRFEISPYIDFYFSWTIPDIGLDFNVYRKFSNNIMFHLGGGILDGAYLSDEVPAKYFNVGIGYNFDSQRRPARVAHYAVTITFAAETVVETSGLLLQ